MDQAAEGDSPLQENADAGPSTSVPEAKQIFITETGEPIKFFIQKDLGSIFIAWLSAQIISHGGLPVPTIPLSGYVLIEPQTPTGARLLAKWEHPEERPDRHVVCYTFVRASIVKGALIGCEGMRDVKSFFRLENAGGGEGGGVPVEILLHESLEEDLREELAVEIEKHGGITTTTESAARIIIAPNGTKQEKALWRELVSRYEDDSDKFIEGVEWVRKCIEGQVFVETEKRVRDKGGRKAGHKRIEFSKEDDEFLIKYIAEAIPNEEAGGRLGNNLYIDIEKDAKRHSWHSWRNRYKIRQLIFDVAIREYVKEHPELLEGGGARERKYRQGVGEPKVRGPRKKKAGATNKAAAPAKSKAKAATKRKARGAGEEEDQLESDSEPEPEPEPEPVLESEVEPESEDAMDVSPSPAPTTGRGAKQGIALRTRTGTGKRRRADEDSDDEPEGRGDPPPPPPRSSVGMEDTESE